MQEIEHLIKMANNRELQQLLTMDDVAEGYHIRKSTLYAMVARRELPSVKIGKRVLFRREDLDAYVQSKVRTSENFEGGKVPDNTDE